jgi:hypothetical protein
VILRNARVLAMLGLGVFARVATAGVGGAQPLPVHWSSTGPASVAGSEAKVRVPVVACIQKGWHLYAMDEPEGGPIGTEFSVSPEGPAALVEVKADRPLRARDATGQMATFYVGQARFELHLRVRPGPGSGAWTLPVTVRYQACNERMCLPPRSEKIEVKLRTE